jgi:cytidylate kinase
LADVTAQIVERDRLDESRPVAPLRPAGDAIVLDSTALSVDDVLDAMQAQIEGPRTPA